MKRFLNFLGLAVLLAALILPMSSAAAGKPASPRTYDVLVGYENPHQGIEVMAYFPSSVTIHPGDTVHWVINSNEIHTVSFGYTSDTLPPFLLGDASGVFVNPVVAERVLDGGEYSGGLPMPNSGVMGREEGTYQDFTLTFPEPGEYDYYCVVHGAIMAGTISVVGTEEAVPSPQKSMAQGNKEIAEALAQVPAVRKAAMDSIMDSDANGDGTMTYHVNLGYGEGQISLVRFFPDKLVVRPGDTVVWEMTQFSDAPHTVTFLNGEPAPPLFEPSGGLLYIAPGTLLPAQPHPDLIRDGFYNSGVIMPGPIGPGDSYLSYSLTIGDMTPGPQPYLCLLHDESGMKGTLVILPH